MPKSFAEWPRGVDVQSYLLSYAVEFNVYPHIKFSHAITQANLENDKWTIAGKRADIDDFTSKLNENIEVRYLQVKAGNHSLIDGDYHARLYGHESEVLFEEKGLMRKGSIKGVDESGRLIMETDKGQEFFSNGEIKLKIA